MPSGLVAVRVAVCMGLSSPAMPVMSNLASARSLILS